MLVRNFRRLNFTAAAQLRGTLSELRVRGSVDLVLMVLVSVLNNETEFGALAVRRLNLDARAILRPEPLSQVLANFQAQPDPLRIHSVLVSEVQLAELLKQDVHVFGQNSDASIADRNLYPAVPQQLGAQRDPTIQSRELYRIAYEVQDDLPHPVRICFDVSGHAGVLVQLEEYTAVVGLHGVQRNAVLQYRPQLCLLVGYAQLALPYLGEI